MRFRPFVGTIFVVEGPDEYRCLGTRLTYGPDTDDDAPIVSWADSGTERFRYVAAPTPPVLSQGGVLTWHSGLGDWLVRPAALQDAAWAYPGWEFTDFDQFRVFAEEATYAGEGEPGPEDGSVVGPGEPMVPPRHDQ